MLHKLSIPGKSVLYLAELKQKVMELKMKQNKINEEISATNKATLKAKTTQSEQKLNKSKNIVEKFEVRFQLYYSENMKLI